MGSRLPRLVLPVEHRVAVARAAQWTIDLLLLAGAFQLAYGLRFDFDVPADEMARMWWQMPYVLITQLLALHASGVRAFVWRYVGLPEVESFLRAALMSSVPIFILRIGLPAVAADLRVPLSVIVTDTIIGFLGVLGVRVLRRRLHEYSDKRRRRAAAATHDSRKKVLLVGAGALGLETIKTIHDHGYGELDVIGFVDDDVRKWRTVIHGVKVLGPIDDLRHLVPRLGIDHVLIAVGEVSRQQLKRILAICDSVPVKVRIVPAMHEILEGKISINRIRDIQVEDLLGRAAVRLDQGGLDRLFGGQVVVVTGAGGSIGSELARQVLRFRPAKLLLVERAEAALFTIDRELRAAFSGAEIHPLVADVADVPRMRWILESYRPEVILHAAAHKHVPMMEQNPTEAVKNNALATYRLAQLVGDCGVGVFVLISTDKAVKPRSVMGATKRLAELAVKHLSGRNGTRYITVRFGNVIGSTGSVLPIFREQIARGGPVTVTHPDVTRYFMTIPEAAQLVLQTAAIGGDGQLFILDMGEPVKILDLAKDTIRLSGLRPHEDIEIEFTGLRPGEKLDEELATAEEAISRTAHQQIFAGAIAPLDTRSVVDVFERLEWLVKSGDEGLLRDYMNDVLRDSHIDRLDRIEVASTMADVPVAVRVATATS